VSAGWSKDKVRYGAIAALVAGLLVALHLNLVAALLAGLLVHELVHAVAPRISFGMRGNRARLFTIGLIATLIIGGLVALVIGALAFFRSEGASPANLLARMADIIDASRASLPEWLRSQMPEDADALRQMLVAWMRDHAREMQVLGKSVGLALVHILFGMVIGAMICLREARGAASSTPLVDELETRVAVLAHAFRSVVFAQVKISAINTTLTALYLAVALPLLGVQLPLVKTMVAVTFVAGLLPVIGNLISNTIIVIVSLSYSFSIAVVSLGFLVAVHKLEYFLNARIIGHEIKASAWELLIAMLAMEAAFGLPGLVAAPIFYAYLKTELKGIGLI
jgi:predicted PurR-regulated permease PerM